jgi:RNA polymerase sigma factor (sigma-70 family)
MNLRRAKSGAQAEFERMFVEHRDRLFAFLVYRCGDRTVAEDLLGDVFERAFRAHARFDPRRGSETTWLYTIALNRLRDHHRRAHVERAVLERVIAAETTVVEAPEDTIAERDRLVQALAVLNQRDREIIALRFGADLTAPQIARVIEQPVTTVEGRLFRALRRLAKAVNENDGAMSDSQRLVLASERRAIA